MSRDSHSPDLLLRANYRWRRHAGPLFILLLGLAATSIAIWWQHPSWARVEQWHSLPAWWVGGILLTFVSAGIVWLQRRKNLLQSAQSLDRRLLAKNRLETAATFRGDESPLARAQRDETASFLGRTPAPAVRSPWLILGCGIVALLLLHVVTLAVWTRPWLRVNPLVEPVAVGPIPKASIKWISPDGETKAVPIAEVPLEATAQSTTGLRDLTLEVSVNGEPRPSQPISLDELKTSGRHEIKVSLYLDQLEVQPYDMVSYYLQATRIDPRPLTATTSPVQFIQVKPFRDDVREMPPGNGASLFPYITALKSAQLRLIKENFILAHADIEKDNANWKKENVRVGDQQALLEQKTDEVIQKIIQGGAPAEIVHLLTQSKSSMHEAAEEIRATNNTPGLHPQGKALSLITEVEKFFVKLAARDGNPKGDTPDVADPFPDRKELELKQRFQTKAGEMELLAAEQKRLAEDLAKARDNAESPPAASADKKDPNKIEGTWAERQTQISQRVGALLNGQVFVPEVSGHLEQAREQARGSLGHLDAGELPAAREPAAAAAMELRLAVEAMNRAGEQQLKDQLASAMKALSDAADKARSAPKQSSEAAAKGKAEEAAKEARKAAADAAEAARQQQETGSEKAAESLKTLTAALGDEQMRSALQGLVEKPMDPGAAKTAAEALENVADQTAQKQGERKPPSAEELTKITQRLEQARANLKRLASSEAAAGRAPSSPGKSPAENKPGAGDNPGKQETGGQGRQGKDQEGKGQEGKGQDGRGGSSGPEAQANSSPGSGPGESNQSAGSGKGTPDSNALGSSATGTPAQDIGGLDPSSSHGGGSASNQPATSPTGTGGHAIDPRTLTPELREQFGRELLHEIRDAVRAVGSFIPKADLETLKALTGTGAGMGVVFDASVVYPAIDPALQDILTTLRLQIQQARRQHQLTDHDINQAPPAYRPAVANYFEQLSEDYQSAASPSPSPDEKQR